MDKKNKIIFSITIGAIAAVIFITAITVAADLYLPLKDWLKNNFHHHWVGKSVLAVAIFFAVSFFIKLLPINIDDNKTEKVLKLLFWLTIFGSLAIFGFFVWEALLK
ncbi:MAG: hypothetical protein AAB496_01910 [Patescibacteria group bacterium]